MLSMSCLFWFSATLFANFMVLALSVSVGVHPSEYVVHVWIDLYLV